MKYFSLLVSLVSIMGILASLSGAVAALPTAPKADAKAPLPTIVLVHGAFADGSGWGRVILLLESKGYSVIAVQNPLSSFAEDVATTKRVIEAQTGPVVVVGHSYGGAVITSAATGNANVKALVYLAAYAPDAGESLGGLGEKFTAPLLATALAPDPAGFLYVNRAQFHAVFCADVSNEEARVLAATQKPLAAAIFADKIETPAWKTIPSWYLVSQDDHAINPELERFMAKRMGAKTTEVKASHVAFLSHPKLVAELIEQAAQSVSK